MTDLRHYAQPGPAYWGFRCLVCGENINDRAVHRPWWKWWGK